MEPKTSLQFSEELATGANLRQINPVHTLPSDSLEAYAIFLSLVRSTCSAKHIFSDVTVLIILGEM
jgi:hypothetical protein